MIVEVANLKKYFGKTKAVDDISFTLSNGDVAGFIGPNGSGKTTTMRIMAAIDAPTEGDVYYNGISGVEYPEKAIAKIGFMPDSLPDIGDMSVSDFIDFFARSFNLRGKERLEAVRRVENMMRLDSMRDKTLKSLSKGMKQRVSLARAIVHDPDFLILDEPAAGLDARARMEVLELISEFSSMGKTLLISSHILSELGRVCDKYVIIEKGRLIATDSDSNIEIKRLFVRFDGQVEQGLGFLTSADKVVTAEQKRNGIEVDFQGNEQEIATLIASMVGGGLRPIEIKHLESDVVDMYMRVTKGEVS